MEKLFPKYLRKLKKRKTTSIKRSSEIEGKTNINTCRVSEPNKLIINLYKIVSKFVENGLNTQYC